MKTVARPVVLLSEGAGHVAWRQSVIHRLGLFLTIATTAWGAFAFGAVYPWAYSILGVMALGAGVLGLLGKDAGSVGYGLSVRKAVSFGLVGGLISLAGAAGLQLLPLPVSALALLNPNAINLLQRLDLTFALQAHAHALSIWPDGTRLALALFGCFAVLLLGAARLMTVAGARRLVEMLMITGVVLALVGIIQRPLYAGKIYGFWTPLHPGVPFGPFVNKNHFAGWMLMVLPVSLGYLCASLAQAMQGVRPTWHDRVVWLSSPDANKLVLTFVGITVMGFALVLTLSRSAIVAFGLALGITAFCGIPQLKGQSRKILAAGYFLLLTTLVIGRVGVGTIAIHFSEADWTSFNGRSGAWMDAAATFNRHWLTGVGLNAYQIANVIYQQHDNEATFLDAAHNDYLQLAAEGGVLFLAPITVCIFFLCRDVRRRFREDGESFAYWLRAGAVTGLLAIALQETVDFSLQIPGNAALFAVICALAVHRSSGATGLL